MLKPLGERYSVYWSYEPSLPAYCTRKKDTFTEERSGGYHLTQVNRLSISKQWHNLKTYGWAAIWSIQHYMQNILAKKCLTQT